MKNYDRNKKALELVDSGLSFGTVAERLGISRSAVSGIVFRRGSRIARLQMIEQEIKETLMANACGPNLASVASRDIMAVIGRFLR